MTTTETTNTAETPIKLPTQDEIVARFKDRQPNDMLGFEVGEYVGYMDYDHAKPFLKEGVTSEEWSKDREPHTREILLKVMKDYMAFAWDKANNCRGISANRSIMHYIAWSWLAGDREFSAEVDRLMDEEYEFYGKNILVKICEFYGWDSKTWDDNRRVNDERE